MSKASAAIASAVVSCIAASLPAAAADRSVPPHVAYVGDPLNCGPCGCMRVTYVYHRTLESTYGVRFDPRNFDQTEPHYYFGRARGFPRYYVDGVLLPAPGSC